MTTIDHTNTWDEDSLEVFRRMDDFDALSGADSIIRDEVLALVTKAFDKIDLIADKILNTELDKRDSHIETMLVLLAMTPNKDAFQHIRSMVENRPDIYEVLFSRVMEEEPLKLTGKVIRERIAFFLRRGAVVENIFSREVSLFVVSALESLRKERRRSYA